MHGVFVPMGNSLGEVWIHAGAKKRRNVAMLSLFWVC